MEGLKAYLSSGAIDVDANSFQEPQCTSGDNISSVVRVFERYSYVGLSSQVVDLVGADGVHPLAERGRVGEVPVVQLHARARLVGIDVHVLQPLRVEVGRSSDDAVHLVSLVQQKLRQVRAILPRDPRHHRLLRRLLHSNLGRHRINSPFTKICNQTHTTCRQLQLFCTLPQSCWYRLIHT